MRNKIFAYTVLGLNVVSAWASWAALADAISGTSRHEWLYPVIVFSLWGIAFTLTAIFVKNKKYIHASFLAGAVGFPFFFGFGLSILGLLLVVLLFIFTEIQAKKEIARGLTINFYRLVSHTLKYFVTAACIAIAVAYYFSITERPQSPTLAVEEKTLQTELEWGLKAASLVLSEDKKRLAEEIANGVTVDEFLSKNFVDPKIDENLAAAKNIVPGGPTETTILIGGATAVQIRQEMLAKSKRDLAEQLGVDVIGERPMKEVLTAYIDKTERSFFEYSGTDKFYVPVILAFGLFLTARILGTAVDIFLGLFILGIIKLLRNLEIINLNKEQREVAMIEYGV